MRISSIDINNYRQYENISLEFNKINKYDLHIIIAENGIGKTTLLNAINWCLYGDQPHITKGLEEKSLPIINLNVLNKMSINDTEEVRVAVSMEILNGTLEFVRTMTIKKIEERDFFKLGEEFKLIKNIFGKESEIYLNNEASNHINRYIPKRIRKFFFFDGEQLDTYFTEQTGANLEQAIFEISQIDILQTIFNNLDTLSTEYRREMKKLVPELEEITEKYEYTKSLIDQKKQKEYKYNRDLGLVKSRLREVNEELREQPDIEDLEEKREQKNNLINSIDLEIQECSKKLRNFIVRYTVLLNVLPELYQLNNIIDDKKIKNQLPIRINKEDLKLILESDFCTVCNQELSDKSVDYIMESIESYGEQDDVNYILNDISVSVKQLIEEAKKYKSERKKLLSEYNRLKNKKDNEVKEYNRVNKVLERYSDKSKIKQLHRERVKLEKEEQRLFDDLVEIKSTIKSLERDFKKIEKKFEAEKDKKAKHLEILGESKVINDAKLIVENVIKDIKYDVRDKIEVEIEKNFFDFIWKKDTFEKIELNDEYSLSIYNKLGFDSLGSCSAAERALLALSFTLALHKESGYAGPLVIDTPLSRISGVLRENFSKVLIDVSLNKEIILFMTEDEYSENVSKIFEGRYSSKIILKLKDEKYVEKEVM